jgi:hypothetical protein
MRDGGSRSFVRIVGTLALVAGFVSTFAPVGAAAGAAWDQLSFPYGYHTPQKSLDDVAALDSTHAWAVGEVRWNGPPPIPAGTVCADLYSWDGRTWTKQPPLGSCQGALHAVSAASSSNVWTVGSTTAYHWNGTTWISTPYPTDPDNARYLADVAAVGNTAFAVGRSYRPVGEVSTAGVLRWDGTAWRKMTIPLPAGNTDLSSVYAVSPDDVWAVGMTNRYGPGTDGHTLVLHWNGSVWTLLPNPPKADLVETDLETVVARGSEAWVGGEKVTYESNGITVKSRDAVAMRWDGHAWTETPTPVPGNVQGSAISSLALNGSEVWAGGNTYDGSSGKWRGTLLRWDGSAWRQAPKPPLAEYGVKRLGGVPGGGVWATGLGTRETDDQATGEYLAHFTGPVG